MSIFPHAAFAAPSGKAQTRALFQRLLRIVAIFAILFIGVALYWRAINPKHVSYGEVVSFDEATQTLLLIDTVDANGTIERPSSVVLFTIGLSEEHNAPRVTDADGNRLSASEYLSALPCGTMLEIVGDGMFLYSAPAVYPNTYDLTVVGTRPDFTAQHLDALVASAQAIAEAEGFTPISVEDYTDDAKNTLAYREQKSAIFEAVNAELGALPDLTEGECNALSRQLESALGWG